MMIGEYTEPTLEIPRSKRKSIGVKVTQVQENRIKELVKIKAANSVNDFLATSISIGVECEVWRSDFTKKKFGNRPYKTIGAHIEPELYAQVIALKSAGKIKSAGRFAAHCIELYSHKHLFLHGGL